MAAAILCDVCNKAYRISKDNHKIRFLIGNGDILCQMSIERTLDCCPECYVKIRNFIDFTTKEKFEND